MKVNLVVLFPVALGWTDSRFLVPFAKGRADTMHWLASGTIS